MKGREHIFGLLCFLFPHSATAAMVAMRKEGRGTMELAELIVGQEARRQEAIAAREGKRVNQEDEGGDRRLRR